MTSPLLLCIGRAGDKVFHMKEPRSLQFTYSFSPLKLELWDGRSGSHALWTDRPLLTLSISYTSPYTLISLGVTGLETEENSDVGELECDV